MRTPKFLPYQQGELDNLCALYSIVNAVALAVRRRSKSDQSLRLTRFGHRQADQLFEELALSVDRSVGLATVLERELKTPMFGKLLAGADRHLCRRHGNRLLWSKPFHRQVVVDSGVLVRRLQRHLEAPHTAVILGYREHWSVASSVTPRRLVLADSSGDSSLAIGGRNRQRRGGTHVGEIWPTSVFLIRLAPLPAGRV